MLHCIGTNSRASKSWVDSMVKQVLSNLHRGVPLSEAGGMSNGMVTKSSIIPSMIDNFNKL